MNSRNSVWSMILVLMLGTLAVAQVPSRIAIESGNGGSVIAPTNPNGFLNEEELALLDACILPPEESTEQNGVPHSDASAMLDSHAASANFSNTHFSADTTTDPDAFGTNGANLPS